MNMTNHVESPYFERLPRYARPALQAAWDKAHGRQFGTVAIYQSFCKDMEEIGHDKPSKPLMGDWIARVQQGLVARPGSQADGADPAVVASLEAVLAEPIEEIVGPVEEINSLISDIGQIAAPSEPAYSYHPNPHKPQYKSAEERAQKRSEAPTAPPLDHQFNSEVLKLFASSEDAAPAVADALAQVRADLRKDLHTACLDGVDDLTDEVVSRAQKMARIMMVEILRELAAEMEAAS